MRIWGWRMIRVLLLLLWLPSIATANAWDVFVERCLDPFENVREPEVSDFTLLQSTEVSDTYQLKAETYFIEINLTNTSFDWGPDACVVASQTDQSMRDLEEGYAKWATSVIASGRYVPSESDPRSVLSPMLPGLLSVGFREPLINVSLMPKSHNRPTFVAVQETFLES